MALVYLGLGTNLGEKERNLNDAIIFLSQEVGFVIRSSTFYTSKPWGFESDNDFLNAVVLIDTNLTPFDVLSKTQEIEKSLGRTAKTISGYSDRLIDIDILLYDNLIIDQPTLKIPHPLIAERDFVIIPLTEIAPELVHPVFGRKMVELLNR
ncbi:MAG: 2-amino-4-hydroxy-6-hydroxymethyldihydropteridine diphosphokinase [Paludibacter sp.]|nr:2-amino-4-hydroxy-6-hydroxymethyldihydropteridine diphosphokinase [Paludibacter sp.]